MTATLTRPDTAARPERRAGPRPRPPAARLAGPRPDRTGDAGRAGPARHAGLVDLAEVRWRTGDLAGAGEAAAVALRGGRGAPGRPAHRGRGGGGARPPERVASPGRASDGQRDRLDRRDLRRDAALGGLAARCRRAATDRTDAVRSGARDARPGPADRTGRRRCIDAPSSRLRAAALVPAPGPMTLGLWDDDGRRSRARAIFRSRRASSRPDEPRSWPGGSTRPSCASGSRCGSRRRSPRPFSRRRRARAPRAC